MTWDLVLYRSWVHHELLALNNAQGVPLGTVNADDTIYQGVEAGLEAELVHDLLVRGVRPDRRLDAKESKETLQQSKADRMVVEQTYHLSDFRFDSDTVYGDHRIAGNPVQAYKAEIRYEHPSGVYFGPNVEWNIVRYPVDEANTLFADPYALLGFRAGYRSQRGVQVYFEAKTCSTRHTPPASSRLRTPGSATTTFRSAQGSDVPSTAECRGVGRWLGSNCRGAAATTNFIGSVATLVTQTPQASLPTPAFRQIHGITTP